MWLKKEHAGSVSGGFQWENDGDCIEVPDALGRELLERDPDEFSEDTDKAPGDYAKSERGKREITEDSAMAARRENESPAGTRLNDGRWAQTDTKGHETVDTGLRDTGAEMAPANVMTGSAHPRATVTPGSSENKARSERGDSVTRDIVTDETQHQSTGGPEGRHEAPDNSRPGGTQQAAAETTSTTTKPATGAKTDTTKSGSDSKDTSKK